MADTKAIANRIKSVSETRKITNAMYLISSTKLRKARKNLDETMPFFRLLRGQISKIIHQKDIRKSRYLISPDDESYEQGVCGLLVITADKGLAGSYNQSVIKEMERLLARYPNYRLFMLGEYGKHYCSSHNIPYDPEFDFPDTEPSLYQARKIAGYIMELFDNRELSQVYIVYTDMKNAFVTEVESFRLVPFKKSYFSWDETDEENPEFEYFPSPVEVMENSIPVYSIGVIYSVLIYSYCSEHNDRMMAMDSANKNADELIKELKVHYNHVRQNSITQEITEISASVKASHRTK